MERDGPAGAGGAMAQGIFTGVFSHMLDPKRRLTIPSEWREYVGQPNSVYVLRGLGEPYLTVYPAREMILKLDKLRQQSIANPRVRALARAVGSQSQMASWDTQGRIRVNDELLSYARIEGEVRLVGALQYFELWSPALWSAAERCSDVDIADVAQQIGL